MGDAPRTSAQALKVEDLLDQVRRGQVRIPRFQRKLRWTPEDNRLLLDSLNRGFPVGSLLFWKRKAPAERVKIGGLSIDAEGGDASYVVDGQQRVNALIEALIPGAGESGRLELDLGSNEVTRGRPNQRTIPLDALGDGVRVLEWLERSKLEPSLRAVALRASKRLREYELPAYVLETDDEKVVQTVFDRLNSQGKRLKREEIFEALDASESSTPSISGLRTSLARLHFGEIPSAILQQTLAAVTGAEITRAFRPTWSPLERTHAYANADHALAAAIQLMRSEADIVHIRLLPYSLTLTILAAFLHRFPGAAERTRKLLVRWVWRVSLLGTAKGDFQQASAFMEAIRQPREADAIRALLQTATTSRQPPALAETYSLGNARSRLEVVVLVRAAILATPRAAEAITQLLNAGRPAKLFRTWRPKATGRYSRSLANVVIQPDEHGQPLAGPNFVGTGDADLENGDALEVRFKRLSGAWEELVRDKGGFSDSDRPSLNALLVADRDVSDPAEIGR